MRPKVADRQASSFPSRTEVTEADHVNSPKLLRNYRAVYSMHTGAQASEIIF